MFGADLVHAHDRVWLKMPASLVDTLVLYTRLMNVEDFPHYQSYRSGLIDRGRLPDFQVAGMPLEQVLVRVKVKNIRNGLFRDYPIDTWVKDFFVDRDAGRFD
jgi:hypothetical protein